MRRLLSPAAVTGQSGTRFPSACDVVGRTKPQVRPGLPAACLARLCSSLRSSTGACSA